MPYAEFETSLLTLIRHTAGQFAQRPDEFQPLRCYEGFKYAFLVTRRLDSRRESLEEYSNYLLSSLEKCLRRVGNAESNLSYNLAMGENWMLVVLRRQERAFKLSSLNALGVLGSVFVKNKEVKEFYQNKRPSEILSEILVPRESLEEYRMEM